MKQFNRYWLVCFFVLLLFGCKSEQNANKETASPDSLLVKQNQFAKVDQSPMDMSYYPVNYPLMKMEGTLKEPLCARLIYSRPHKKGRLIFGDSDKSLCKYGREWRLGANEATEIQFFRDVYIKGTKIAEGSYVMYCIPYIDKWTIVLNTNINTWGLHVDTSKDIFKTDIPVQTVSPAIEDFTMVFQQAKYGTDLLMAWDTVKVVLPISFTP